MTDAPIITNEDAAIDSAFFGSHAELATRVPTTAAGFWSCAKSSLSASRR